MSIDTLTHRELEFRKAQYMAERAAARFGASPTDRNARNWAASIEHLERKAGLSVAEITQRRTDLALLDGRLVARAVIPRFNWRDLKQHRYQEVGA